MRGEESDEKKGDEKNGRVEKRDNLSGGGMELGGRNNFDWVLLLG
jgi:hypothetical protein